MVYKNYVFIRKEDLEFHFSIVSDGRFLVESDDKKLGCFGYLSAEKAIDGAFDFLTDHYKCLGEEFVVDDVLVVNVEK